MNTKPTISYTNQFAILIGLIGVSFIIASLAAAGAWVAMTGNSLFSMAKDIIKPEYANAAKWTQLIAAFIMFFVPSVVFARIIQPNPLKQLGFSSLLSGKQFFLVICVAITAMGLSGALGTLNEMIPIPTNWATKFKKAEDDYVKQLMTIAKMNNWKEYIFSLIVIALAPAIFEETLFRGAIQRLLQNWFKNVWAAIIITSIIFSLVHLSYYGFLARVGLGVILGLIFYYSRNIWLSILAHFLNNAIAVSVLYVMGTRGENPEKALNENFPLIYGVIALLLIVLLLRLFKKESKYIGAENLPDGSPSFIKSNNPFE
ncbi:MAG: CPBP family intramembrane metalloprotease [Chitinophagaceae bacterium]|nr:CPBP family intramembrane metalloprotease [Chitinophagaceae bacterium]MCW5906038.1 CPBP family intramembrane metalloprotease [Chitinophagaceae bacterium]